MKIIPNRVQFEALSKITSWTKARRSTQNPIKRVCRYAVLLTSFDTLSKIGSNLDNHPLGQARVYGGQELRSVADPAHPCQTILSMLNAPSGHLIPLIPQIHFLRLVLDEGHLIGTSLGRTNKLDVATRLRAERRWVMTGTPTPSR